MHVREVEAVSFLMFGINGVWKAFFEKLNSSYSGSWSFYVSHRKTFSENSWKLTLSLSSTNPVRILSGAALPAGIHTHIIPGNKKIT